MILRLSLLLILLCSSFAGAKDFYAAPLSTSCYPENPGTGTKEDPFKHPYYALYTKKVGCGDTLILRGGTYRGQYSGFYQGKSPEERAKACDEDYDVEKSDGKHTLLPIRLNCSPDSPLVIQNYLGEAVVLDGTDADVTTKNKNFWSRCESSSKCGDAIDLKLPDFSRTYYTEQLDNGSSRTTQIWINPPSITSAGTRLAYVADSKDLKAGTFAVILLGPKKRRRVIVQLPSDVKNDNPNDNVMKISGKLGDAAGNVIAVNGGRNIILRKNPNGGAFIIKYAYYGVMVDRDGQQITADGLDFIATGGRDYGGCFRVLDGDYVTVKNGVCRESMSHGIFFYGGGPDKGTQLSHCTVENMTMAHMGRAWQDGGGLGDNLGTGVIMKNCDSCTAQGNLIYDTFRNGVQVNYSKIDCDNKKCYSNNPVIEGNEIFNNCHFRNNQGKLGGISDCAAINVVADPNNNGGIEGATIRNNIIRGAYAPAFSNQASPMGIQLDGQIPKSVIANNTVFQTGGACISVEPNSEPVVIQSNIMDDCGSCDGKRCNLYIHSRADEHIISNNVYWKDEFAIRIKTGGDITPKHIKTVDKTALVAAPDFVSETNLCLKQNSPMKGRGVSTDRFCHNVKGDD